MTEISTPQLAAAEELGKLLRQNREQQQLSLGDVSEHLKLPARQVEALENADFSKLPEPVFVRGFLRSYGRYLNLDEAVLNSYLEQIVAPSQFQSPLAKEDGNVKMTYHNAPIKKPFRRCRDCGRGGVVANEVQHRTSKTKCPNQHSGKPNPAAQLRQQQCAGVAAARSLRTCRLPARGFR